MLLVSFFIEGGKAGLLDLAAAGGSALLPWATLSGLAETVCEKLAAWRLFLLGFVPVYEGVLAVGGETAAAAAAGGLFLAGLCVLAQLLCSWVPPLLHCYLALSVACCISTEAALASACRSVGRLFRQGLGWTGKIFGALLGLQRIFTAQLDTASRQLGHLLTGTVPIIGQSLSDAADAVLGGLQMLKTGLGFAAIAVLAAEFLPLYIILMVHAMLLFGCELLCTAGGIGRCAALFNCLREAVQGLAAATALFFGIAVLGTALLFAMGGGREMQQFKLSVAVFCSACICAELVGQLLGGCPGQAVHKSRGGAIYSSSPFSCPARHPDRGFVYRDPRRLGGQLQHHRRSSPAAGRAGACRPSRSGAGGMHRPCGQGRSDFGRRGR